MGHHDSDTDSDTSMEDDIPPLLPLLLLALFQRRPRTTNRRWTGQEVVDDLLNCGNPTRIHNQLRMELGTFFQLRDWLVLNTALKDSSPESSRFVSVEEKLLIFVYIASTGASNRATQERFNRAPSMISRYILISVIPTKLINYSSFHEVIDALLLLYKSNCTLPYNTLTTPTRISESFKYSPYFNDCLGALDGTHIEMHIPLELQPRYRNRKGTLSQNVLAVCDFDMRFVYILAGWEGSAHDSRVLSDAQASKGFLTPKGKYWLGDAGYGNSEFVMAPFRGVRYHLKEVRQANQKPENAKELFNLRHSSLRNVIERIFGVLKRQWQILGGKGCEYSINTQTDLFCALIGLYNFGKQHGEEDLFITDEVIDIEVGIEGEVEGNTMETSSTWMNQKRDQIAAEMWKDYQRYI
jgi:hypothetical protein